MKNSYDDMLVDLQIKKWEKRKEKLQAELKKIQSKEDNIMRQVLEQIVRSKDFQEWWSAVNNEVNIKKEG